MITSMIIGIIALSVILIAHELGHFITAKASGVRVHEFGLGFPPKLVSVTRGETQYSLNAIPFGGFIKLAGEEDPEVPRSLASKSVGIRLLVLSAGSLMNVLLPLILFTIAFMIPHDLAIEPIKVKAVAPDSPAVRAGIEPGDTLLEINGNPAQNVSDLHRSVQLHLGREMTILVQHADSTAEKIQVIPRWRPPQGQGAIGIELDPEAARLNRSIINQQYPFWKAVPLAVTESIETLVIYKNGIIRIFIGTAPASLVGPVGIAQITGEIAKAGISPLLEVAALISLVLGVVNLFPLPALDGGRVAFVLLEWMRRGRRISPKIEGRVHYVGFILLLAVLFMVTYQDILRIISGDSLIP